MKGTQYKLNFVTSYFREFVSDPDTMDDGVRKNLYNYDVKDIPFCENQDGYWRDLELVENIWKKKSKFECLQSFSGEAKRATVKDTFACTTYNKQVDVSSSGSLALAKKPFKSTFPHCGFSLTIA